VSSIGFENELCAEIRGESVLQRGLVITQAASQDSVWAQDVWSCVQTFSIDEVLENPEPILHLAKEWHFYPGSLLRHHDALDKIFHFIKPSRFQFGKPLPNKNFAVLAMPNAKTVLVSASTQKPVPFGRIEFVEDKTNPPNRAYLKLWEAFTWMGHRPQKSETCLDLGASPGGWTWVLSGLGANVTAIDKSELAVPIQKLPNVTFRLGSAFSVQPLHHEPVDWIFSDVICYPKRLLTFVKRWLDSGKVKNMVCTIKLQGDTDFSVIREFQNIPNSHLLHLYHNKHELTWIYPKAPNWLQFRHGD